MNTDVQTEEEQGYWDWMDPTWSVQDFFQAHAMWHSLDWLSRKILMPLRATQGGQCLLLGILVFFPDQRSLAAWLRTRKPEFGNTSPASQIMRGHLYEVDRMLAR